MYTVNLTETTSLVEKKDKILQKLDQKNENNVCVLSFFFIGFVLLSFLIGFFVLLCNEYTAWFTSKKLDLQTQKCADNQTTTQYQKSSINFLYWIGMVCFFFAWAIFIYLTVINYIYKDTKDLKNKTQKLFENFIRKKHGVVISIEEQITYKENLSTLRKYVQMNNILSNLSILVFLVIGIIFFSIYLVKMHYRLKEFQKLLSEENIETEYFLLQNGQEKSKKINMTNFNSVLKQKETHMIWCILFLIALSCMTIFGSVFLILRWISDWNFLEYSQTFDMLDI